MFTWYRDITRTERVTFWTCFGGWALDALDVQMFSLVIPALIATWHVSNTEAGLVGGVTLVTSAMRRLARRCLVGPHRPRAGACR